MKCLVDMIELEYILQEQCPKQRKMVKRGWGVHPINQMRREQGHFHNLFKVMQTYDHEVFFNYTRMSPERFDHLFELIETGLTKNSPNAMTVKCRLLLLYGKGFKSFLSDVTDISTTSSRFLASADSLKNLHYNFRLGVSTAHSIIAETCDAI